MLEESVHSTFCKSEARGLYVKGNQVQPVSSGKISSTCLEAAAAAATSAFMSRWSASHENTFIVTLAVLACTFESSEANGVKLTAGLRPALISAMMICAPQLGFTASSNSSSLMTVEACKLFETCGQRADIECQNLCDRQTSWTEHCNIYSCRKKRIGFPRRTLPLSRKRKIELIPAQIDLCLYLRPSSMHLYKTSLEEMSETKNFANKPLQYETSTSHHLTCVTDVTTRKNSYNLGFHA